MGYPVPVPRTAKFSFAQARGLVGDLQKPAPRIYWTDFLFSVIGGHIAFIVVYRLPQIFPEASWRWYAAAAAYVACIILYMRAVMFIHELVHLPKEGFRGFRIAWNALCGIPFLVPSFLYYPHLDHHRRKHYGTEHDGEYLSLSHHGPWMIVGFIVQSLIIPFLGVLRFAVISPICWLFPKARPLIHRHASTMVVDPFYRRNDLSPRVHRMVIVQEVLCFLWCIAFAARAFILGDGFSDPIWPTAYAVAIGLVTLNELRTLGAHRWTGRGEQMTFEQQMLDSVNYPHAPWISELWGPVGTRYHALHHLFPSIPYHNLGKAHRRLIEGLPPDSPYRLTVAPSLTSEIKALWKRSLASVAHRREEGPREEGPREEGPCEEEPRALAPAESDSV